MKFAIIAAGEGSRLANEGIATPKPLIKAGGIPIMERLIKIFLRNGATGVSVIINERQPETLALLKHLQKELPIEIVVKNTVSSMHSLHALAPLLANEEKFCLTTVDTLFREEEFTRYIEAFRKSDADGVMAVTDYIDDEKPLYVATGNDMRITAFADNNNGGVIKYVSGGIYGLTPRSLATLQRCIKEGTERMRNFQRALIADGLKLTAHPFDKIIDIDHAEDIEKAEKFLETE